MRGERKQRGRIALAWLCGTLSVALPGRSWTSPGSTLRGLTSRGPASHHSASPGPAPTSPASPSATSTSPTSPSPTSHGPASRGPTAVEILRRAEDVRSPNLDYAVDLTIALREDGPPPVAQSGSYTMIARGKNLSMVMLLEPKGFRGTTLLIRDGAYWLVAPTATKPLQISAAQVLSGDVSNGDIARADLLADYEPRLTGEEALDQEPCWRLELTTRRPGVRYPRIRAWIAKRKFLPLKLEFYGQPGTLIKTARYGDYRKTSLGLRSMRLDVESALESHRKTAMVFTSLRRVDAAPVEFSPEGMLTFRNTALALMQADGAPAPTRDLLKALRSARRARK